MKLYDYQEKTKNEILELLEVHQKCYLMAQERFGKTHTVLTALEQMEDVRTVLFVTVKNAIQGIANDYVDGKYKTRMAVINYESLHKILEKRWDAIVYDESTKLAAYPKPSKAYKMAREFKSKYTLWLNATPNVETLSQRYHQLQVVDFWEEPNFYKWFKKYGIPATIRTASGQEVADYSHTKETEILNASRHLYIQGTREDAGFEHHTTKVKEIIVEPTPQQTEISNAIMINKMWKNNVIADTKVKEMMKLHQITGGFVYDEEKNAENIATNKLDFIERNSEGDKIAIYAKYTYEVNLLIKHFNAETDVHEFKKNNSRYLVKQIRAGSKGIDLSFCSQHWFYSLDFSGEVFIQAIARMHNKKRKDEVEAFILTTRGMIDRDVLKAVQNKDNFNTRMYRGK